MTSPSPAPAALRGHGFSVRLPPRWEGRIYRRTAGPGTAAKGDAPSGDAEAVVHLGNFALPGGRGDFGTGAVEHMGPQNLFIAVLEYGPAERGTALFAPEGLPLPEPDDFRPDALQRVLRGQAGYQRFCTVADRPLCLYVVLGSSSLAWSARDELSAVLKRIEVLP